MALTGMEPVPDDLGLSKSLRLTPASDLPVRKDPWSFRSLGSSYGVVSSELHDVKEKHNVVIISIFFIMVL